MLKNVRLLSAAFMSSDANTQTAMLEVFSQLPDGVSVADNQLIDNMLSVNRDGSNYILLFVRTDKGCSDLSTLVIEDLAVKFPSSDRKNKICAGLEVDEDDVSRVVHMAAMCNLKVMLIGGTQDALIGMTEGIGAYTGTPTASLYLQSAQVNRPHSSLLEAALLQYKEGEIGRLSAITGTPAITTIDRLDKTLFTDLNTLYVENSMSWSKAVICHADYLAGSKLPSMITVDLTSIEEEEKGTDQLPMTMSHARVFVSRSCNRLKSRYLHIAPPSHLSDKQCAHMLAELILRFYQSHEARSSINLNYQPL